MEGSPVSTTTAKPRAGRRTPTPAKWAMRAEKVRAVVTSANRRAARVGSDEKVNRSTRQRNVLKAKADAFDHIALILAGKDA
jgi:hypothetical protein